jgi:5-hydroxyisourate hydrolase-like protein (transthyretin family)
LVQAFPQGFQALASLFPAIFTAAAVRRRRKPWGIVYDSITGKPVDLAVVRVFNESNDKLVATKVTDQNGRFNFLLARGKYYVTVTKAGYIFPPKISKLKAYQLSTRFGPQSDIYFGQPFVIGADDTNVNLNIGLDHKTRNLSLANKTIIWVKNGLDWFLIGLSYFAVPLMILGAIFASLAVVVAPSTFHLVLSGFYVLLLIAYLIGSRIQAARIGTVFDSISKKPIAKATVSIFDKEYNAIREIKTTDQNGRFAILAQRGQYYLTVQAKGYKFPSKEFSYQKKDKKLGHIYLGETINNKKPGFVSVHIPLDKEEKK